MATQAIFLEEEEFSRALGTASAGGVIPWLKEVTLPTIVTSAHIFTCDFDSGDVDPATGEIPSEIAATVIVAPMGENSLTRALHTVLSTCTCTRNVIDNSCSSKPLARQALLPSVDSARRSNRAHLHSLRGRYIMPSHMTESKCGIASIVARLQTNSVVFS